MPPGPAELRARADIDEIVATMPDRSPARLRDFLAGRMATATVLRRLDDASGGGFFAVPAEAEKSEDAARAVFGRGASPYVIDVQTHLVNPGRWDAAGAEALAGFLAMVDGPRWEGGVDPTRLSGAMWAAHLFGESETNVALLTSVPGRSHENVLTNQEIASCRDLVDRYSGTRRVLTHTIVHPNLGASEVDRIEAWSAGAPPGRMEGVHPVGSPRVTRTGRRRAGVVSRRRGGRTALPRIGSPVRTADRVRPQGHRRPGPARLTCRLVPPGHRTGRPAVPRPDLRRLPLRLRGRSRRRGGAVHRRGPQPWGEPPGRQP